MTTEERIKSQTCYTLDCFGCKNCTCEILTEAIPDNCPFYKTRNRAKADRAEALKRIKSLDPGERDYILAKYYRDYHSETKNKKDWLKEG